MPVPSIVARDNASCTGAFAGRLLTRRVRVSYASSFEGFEWYGHTLMAR